jgi:hypothetical protein
MPLATFQSWMQAVLVHPGGAGAGLFAPEARRLVAPEEASGVVRERESLGAAERLQIYASMYPLRMRDALRADFPALAALLGERLFGKLVDDYVLVHPSRSFTLARLGDRLPEFVSGWGSPRRRALLADVATLEKAAAEVFDGDEPTPMDPSVLRELPVPDWARATLVTASTFRLARVRPGAVDVLDAFLEGRPLPGLTGRGRVEVAFYRRDFVVLRRTLGPFDGGLLAALAAGETLGAAFETAAKTFPGGFPSGEILSGWFAEWTSLGFFSGIERASAESRGDRGSRSPRLDGGPL